MYKQSNEVLRLRRQTTDHFGGKKRHNGYELACI